MAHPNPNPNPNPNPQPNPNPNPNPNQAILNSCSIAASVLTTSALITEVPEEDPNGGMGPGMGDMM